MAGGAVALEPPRRAAHHHALEACRAAEAAHVALHLSARTLLAVWEESNPISWRLYRADVDAAQGEGAQEPHREDAVDLWQFTRLITEHYSISQKVTLLEIMWGLVHSDGTLEDREVYFMRKICNLLRLEPGYLAQARQRYLGEE